MVIGGSLTPETVVIPDSLARRSRGSDVLTGPLANLSTSGAFSLGFTFQVPRLPPSGVLWTLWSAYGASVNDQLLLRVNSAGELIPAFVIGGVLTNMTALGTIVPNTTYRVGLSFNGTSTYRALLIGGGDQNSTAASVPGLTETRFGAEFGGVNQGSCRFGRIENEPTVLAGAALTTFATNIP
jgi:hypothetical protein